MTSGITSHERVEPEYDVEILWTTEPVTLRLISFALVQLGLLIALMAR